MLLDPLPAREAFLLRTPHRRLIGRALFQGREFIAKTQEPVPRALVGLLLERLPLDLQLDDAPVELVELLGLGIDLHPEPARSLVDEVDGLVGQEAIGDVAVGERSRRDERVVGDGDAVMHFVLLFQAAQDGHRVLHGGLRDVDGLKAPRQRSVLLHMLAVFVQGRGADAVQLAPGKRGLEQVGGVHRALGCAGTHERVQLVDEHDDLAGRSVDFGEHGLQALLELATELGAGHHGAEIEGEKPLVPERFGDVAVDDPLGQAFDDRSLADPRLADDDRVVLGPPREDLHDAADFFVTADHRIDRPAARRLGQVARILLERVVAGFGGGAIRRPPLAQVVDRRIQSLRAYARVGQDAGSRRSLGERERQQKALGGDVAVAGLFRNVGGGIEEPRRLRREIDLACAVALYLRQRVENCLGLLQRVFRPASGSADEIGGEAFCVIQQNLEQVLRREALVAPRGREALRRLHEAARALGKLVEIHVPSLAGHPLPRAERGRALMASCEARGRMPGR